MAGTVTILAPAAASVSAPVRDFGLEVDGEIAVRNGDFVVARGRVAVAQGIRCRLRLMLGENVADQTKGLDWLGSILVKNPSQLLVRELVREQILDTPDVTDATVGELVPQGDRQYAVSAQAADVYSAEPLLVEVAS